MANINVCPSQVPDPNCEHDTPQFKAEITNFRFRYA